MNTVQQSLSQMSLDFHKRMEEFEAKLLKESSAPATIASLTAEFASFKSLTTQSLNNLQGQLEAIVKSVDILEMRGRRKILLLHGVVEAKKEDTAQVVADVIKSRFKLEQFSSKDIKRCQRLGRKTGSQKPRPLLLKLHDVSTRDSIWFNKTKLKGSGITVSEFLTKTRHDVFIAAREKFGVNNCWTREGNVFVLGPDEKHHRVTSLIELNRIGDSTDKPATTAKPVTTKPRRTATTKK